MRANVSIFVQDKTVWLDQRTFYIKWTKPYSAFNDEWKKKFVRFCVDGKYLYKILNIFHFFYVSYV